jgi:hypothetical protein
MLKTGKEKLPEKNFDTFTEKLWITPRHFAILQPRIRLRKGATLDLYIDQ